MSLQARRGAHAVAASWLATLATHFECPEVLLKVRETTDAWQSRGLGVGVAGLELNLEPQESGEATRQVLCVAAANKNGAPPPPPGKMEHVARPFDRAELAALLGATAVLEGHEATLLHAPEAQGNAERAFLQHTMQMASRASLAAHFSGRDGPHFSDREGEDLHSSFVGAQEGELGVEIEPQHLLEFQRVTADAGGGVAHDDVGHTSASASHTFVSAPPKLSFAELAAQSAAADAELLGLFRLQLRPPALLRSTSEDAADVAHDPDAPVSTPRGGRLIGASSQKQLLTFASPSAPQLPQALNIS